MNIARLFSYTRNLEAERDFLRRRLVAEVTRYDREFQRSQEIIDSVMFHRLPKRLIESEPQDKERERQKEGEIEIPPRPETMNASEYEQWKDKLLEADPLTMADMLAESEMWNPKMR